MWGSSGVVTAANVDLVTSNNVTYEDAFQFDPPGMTGCPPPPYWPCGATGPTWGFTGQNFRMDIKGNKQQPSPLLSFTSAAGEIVVQDVTNRILNFNVPESTYVGVLVPGVYVYDFIMFDNSSPS